MTFSLGKALMFVGKGCVEKKGCVEGDRVFFEGEGCVGSVLIESICMVKEPSALS